MALVRWSPLREMATLSERLNRLMSDVSPREAEEELAFHWAPPVDIFEDTDEIEMSFELPGFEQADIDIEVNADVLTISGERRAIEEKQLDHYRRIERAYGRFVRSFSQPDTVDLGGIKAHYEDGILRLRLPKTEKAKPKRISVEID